MNTQSSCSDVTSKLSENKAACKAEKKELQSLENRVCSICHSNSGSKHIFREMMFDSRDEFAYWECDACGCLQIATVPEHIDKHYPADYYSFSQELKRLDVWFYRIFFKAPYLGGRLRWLLRNPFFADGKFHSIAVAKPKRGAKILDVGCGSGHLVSVLRGVGFDAHGIDAYSRIETPCIRRATLDQASDGWDLITFNHALEHMTDHLSVLRSAREKLAADGICLVRIPIAAWAWKHYGKNWVQLDAPRHLIIHTQESFRLVAEEAGFEVSHVEFDSTIFQHVGSELYKRDLPLSHMALEEASLTKETRQKYYARTAELNRQQLGDQASFYLKIPKTKRRQSSKISRTMDLIGVGSHRV